MKIALLMGGAAIVFLAGYVLSQRNNKKLLESTRPAAPYPSLTPTPTPAPPVDNWGY